MSTVLDNPTTIPSAGPVPNPLASSTMLVSLRISRWSGLRQDKRIAQEASHATGAVKSSLTGSKHLVPTDAFKDIQKAESAARAIHYKHTLPWLDDGPRILSASAFFDYGNELRPIMDEFKAAADRFATDYPILLADAPRRLGSLYDSRQFPATTTIRDRFEISTAVVPFPSADDFRITGLDSAVQAQIRAQLAEIPAKVEQIARQEIADRVTDVASRMVERLDAYTGGREGSFRDSLVENVRELVDILPRLNVTQDARIDTLRDRLGRLTTYDADELRKSKSAREAVAYEAQQILDQMGAFLA